MNASQQSDDFEAQFLRRDQSAGIRWLIVVSVTCLVLVSRLL